MVEDGPVPRRSRTWVVLGIFACILLAAATVWAVLAARERDRRERFVAAIVEEARRPTPDWPSENISFDIVGVHLKKLVHAVAGATTSNIPVEFGPGFDGSLSLDLGEGLELDVLYDTLALEQSGIARHTDHGALFEKLPCAWDEGLLDQLQLELRALPHTKRMRSLYAASEIVRRRRLASGSASVVSETLAAIDSLVAR